MESGEPSCHDSRAEHHLPHSNRSRCDPSRRSSVTALADDNASRYVLIVIRSFADAETERLFARIRSRRFPAELQRIMLRKLVQVHAADKLQDLGVPPGNRLEALKGDRADQHSIRVNDRWRVCFRWLNGDAFEVEIVDYH